MPSPGLLRYPHSCTQIKNIIINRKLVFPTLTLWVCLHTHTATWLPLVIPLLLVLCSLATASCPAVTEQPPHSTDHFLLPHSQNCLPMSTPETHSSDPPRLCFSCSWEAATPWLMEKPPPHPTYLPSITPRAPCIQLLPLSLQLTHIYFCLFVSHLHVYCVLILGVPQLS